MKLSLKALLVALCFAAPTFAIAGTETLNFDTLNGEDFAYVPNGYGGLDWANFQVMSHSFEQTNYAGTHGDDADVSAPNFIYDGGGSDASISSSTPFTLESMDLSSFFADSNDVTITGYNGLDIIGSVSFTVDGTSTLETVDLENVTGITFSSSEGTHFTIDNMTLSGAAIPEPPAMTNLLLSALAMAGAGAFRRLARA